jgi:dihydroorotate dehydrogenase
LKFYETILGPVLGVLDPELAHTAAIRALKANLIPAPPREDRPILKSKVWGLEFPNPVGVAAGFDKNGDVPAGLLKLGFGFVEVGTVTPRPQTGNPRPRMFRLREDRAIINRLGFNSRGIEYVSARMEERLPGSPRGVVGVNVGMNRDARDPISDYVSGIRAFKDMADYLVINISSPNTPGLRDLQDKEKLETLLAAANRARTGGPDREECPLLIKVAPDLAAAQIAEIAAAVVEHRIDGIIATNTTVARPSGLKSRNKLETGGLSGKPLCDVATDVIRDLYGATQGQVPLIGVGGIFGGAEAYAKIRAGASLVQLYSGMVFRGPWIAGLICGELCDLLQRDGFSNLGEAIGADHR